jgi:hypothetical protein
MNDCDPTRSPHGTLPARTASGATSGPPVPASSPDSSASITMAKRARPPSNRECGWTVAAALMSAVIGVSAGCSSSPSTTATSPSATADAGDSSTTADAGDSSATADAGDSSATADAGDSSADDGAFQARSPPSQGGTSGTVDSVSTPSFTLTTPAGQQVTVDETSSTTYLDGTLSTSATAITTGENVLVLGTVNSTTITATQVTLEPNDDGGAAASAEAGVVPFQPGTPSPAKSVGQIPTDYTEGDGTIVGGTTADQATEAALAAYPGIVVDRVVQLSGGDAGGAEPDASLEYEVHCISVNWPHHIFVDQDFTVVGAD